MLLEIVFTRIGKCYSEFWGEIIGYGRCMKSRLFYRRAIESFASKSLIFRAMSSIGQWNICEKYGQCQLPEHRCSSNWTFHDTETNSTPTSKWATNSSPPISFITIYHKSAWAITIGWTKYQTNKPFVTQFEIITITIARFSHASKYEHSWNVI